MRTALRRLLSGSAAALMAAAVVGAAGTPALADEPTLSMHFPDISVAGKAPKVNPLFAWIDVPADAPTPAGPLTVTVDTADVDQIATVVATDEFEEGDEQSCQSSGAVITCTLTGPLDLGPGTNLVPLLALSVTAKSGAAKGADGKLAFTAQLAGGPGVAAQSTVTIGEGVDLAGVIAKPATVAPGASVATDLRVSNTGVNVVHGAVLVMVGWDPSLVEGKGFSNCTYGILTVCTFDDDLATGTTYDLSTPMRLKIPADAAAGSRASALGSWFTPSDFKELLDIVPGTDDEILGPKGTGGPVTLQAITGKGSSSAGGPADSTPADSAVMSSLAQAGQVDVKPDNNLVVSDIVVGGSRKPDMSAVGATVSGSPGDKVHVGLGFTNNGPGTLYYWSFENTDPGTHVIVPAGLRAVQVDKNCFPTPSAVGSGSGETDEEDLTGAPEYVCFLEGGKTKAKASSLYDFTFQVRDDASSAAGQVRINEEEFTGVESIDRDPSNNTAEITVKLSGGEGGGLPVTGANAALIGTAGGVLLLAGALGLLLVRRRRVRFTA